MKRETTIKVMFKCKEGIDSRTSRIIIAQARLEIITSLDRIIESWSRSGLDIEGDFNNEEREDGLP